MGIGTAFHPADIDRFRKNARVEAEKIEQMSNARRLRPEVYAVWKSPKKLEKQLFLITASALDENVVRRDWIS